MSNVQVNKIVDAVLAGDVQGVTEIASDNSISITHLMLACKEFCDPTELARECNKVSPAQRRGVFVQALSTAAATVQSKPAPVETMQELLEGPADVVQEEQLSIPIEQSSAPKPTRSRARKPAAVAQQVVEEQVRVVEREQPAIDLSGIENMLAEIISEVQQTNGRLKALDTGMSSDIGTCIEKIGVIGAQVSALAKSVAILDEKVEKFRAGTEALEIALIAKGILESAPFADSWNA
jgi:hypothetical protein